MSTRGTSSRNSSVPIRGSRPRACSKGAWHSPIRHASTCAAPSPAGRMCRSTSIACSKARSASATASASGRIACCATPRSLQAARFSRSRCSTMPRSVRAAGSGRTRGCAPGRTSAEDVHIGNFVEVKASRLRRRLQGEPPVLYRRCGRRSARQRRRRHDHLQLRRRVEESHRDRGRWRFVALLTLFDQYVLPSSSITVRCLLRAVVVAGDRAGADVDVASRRPESPT